MGNNKVIILKTRFGHIIILVLVLVALYLYFLKSREQWVTIKWGNNLPRFFSWGQHARLQYISECGCKRNFFYGAPENHTKRLNSTCSDEGSFYDTGQKVVSLSMYIKDPGDLQKIQQYKDGMTENLRRMKEYYPGNTMRVYTDMGLEAESDYCKLVCLNPQVHWCNVKKTPSLGDQSNMIMRTWRFLPLGDPTVDYFLSRDLDSVILERQVAAVNEWLQSSKAFHLMRDKYPEHNAPLLAGLWGASNAKLGLKNGEALRKEIMKLAKIPSKTKSRDQEILNKVIFYPKLKDIVAFDSYFCMTWGKLTEVRPFPFKRTDTQFDFAGNYDLGHAKYNISSCPVECRPEYGKDWEYC